MRLGDYVNIRTGLPLSRKQAKDDTATHIYSTITLKALSDDGYIDTDFTELFYAAEPLKQEYFTNVGDVLIRLSAPYTAAVIEEGKDNLLVSQHFSIIRIHDGKLNPHFLCWWLAKNRKKFYQSASGATLMGTISSGYINELPFLPPPIRMQHKIGILLKLAMRETELLMRLSKAKIKLVNTTITKITTEITEGNNP